jgi:hypothetical protein
VSPRLRWGLWLTLLAVASGLVLWDRGRALDADIVEDVGRKSPGLELNQAAPRARAETTTEGPMIIALRPRTTTTRIADSFAPHDWTAPPPAKALPPPLPTAPPVPYTVLGKKFEAGEWQVFLAHEDRVFVVKPQDMIENTYRVEDTMPPLMTLTYLPLQQRQTLPIGDAE